jgi:hypothetical protein
VARERIRDRPSLRDERRRRRDKSSAKSQFYSAFVARGAMPEPPKPVVRFEPGTPDMYDFSLRTPVPLARMNADLFGGRAAYWQEIVDHTTYDNQSATCRRPITSGRYIPGRGGPALATLRDASDSVGSLVADHARAVEVLARESGGLRMLCAGATKLCGASRGSRRRMDAFSEVLNGVRLKGAMFFRAEFSAPWQLSTKAGSLRPRLDRRGQVCEPSVRYARGAPGDGLVPAVTSSHEPSVAKDTRHCHSSTT